MENTNKALTQESDKDAKVWHNSRAAGPGSQAED